MDPFKFSWKDLTMAKQSRRATNLGEDLSKAVSAHKVKARGEVYDGDVEYSFPCSLHFFLHQCSTV